MKKSPSYCCIAITERCFLNCRICYKWKDGIGSRDPDEPSLKQWKDFIVSLRGLVEPPFQLNFAGGEALIHENTLPLIEYASDKGLTTLLASNAWLIDEKMAGMLNDSGLNAISISLDGITEKTHDFIRGANGSYKKVLKAIELLNNNCPDLKIHICTLISAVNMHELRDLALWVNDNDMIDGIAFQAVTQPFNTPIEDNWHLNADYSYLWPDDPNAMNGVIDSLAEIKKKHKDNKINNPVLQFSAFKAYFRNPNSFLKKGVTCHLDDNAVNVTPCGDMFFCFYMDPIGNIKKDRIAEIWLSDKNEEQRRRIRSCKRNCQAVVNCNYEEEEIDI